MSSKGAVVFRSDDFGTEWKDLASIHGSQWNVVGGVGRICLSSKRCFCCSDVGPK